MILTVYNRPEFLSQAVQSVRAQTFKDWELILWDDGSTDTTYDVARRVSAEDSRIRLYRGSRQGRALALSNAIAAANGEYLGWIDSDDMLEPAALEVTVTELEANPTVGMVYTDYIDIAPDGQFLSRGSRCQIPYSPDRLLTAFMTFHFRLIRMSVLNQLDPVIDPQYPTAQDYDLCLRLSEITNIIRIPTVLYKYRTHPTMLSRVYQLDQIQESARIVRAALRRRGLTDRVQLQVQYRGVFSLVPIKSTECECQG